MNTKIDLHQVIQTRIKLAKQTRKLDLSNLGLRTIPDEVFQLNSVVELNLSGNKLKSIPKKIAKLHNLKILNLSKNQLTVVTPFPLLVIPKDSDFKTNTDAQLHQMPELQVLDFSANRIQIISKDFSNSISVKDLNISYNPILEIPYHISQIKNLKKLRISSNQKIDKTHFIGIQVDIETDGEEETQNAEHAPYHSHEEILENKTKEATPSYTHHYEEVKKFLHTKDYSSFLTSFQKVLKEKPNLKEIISISNQVSAFTEENIEFVEEFTELLFSNLEKILVSLSEKRKWKVLESFNFINQPYYKYPKLQLRILEGLDQIGVKNPQLSYIQGFLYFHEKDFEKAIQVYSQAIQLNPIHDEYYNARGRVYFETGNLEEAISDFSKAIQMNPTTEEAYLNRGICYSLKGNYDEALSDFSVYEKKNKENPILYLEKANIKIEKGDIPSALNDLESYLNLCPNDIDVLYKQALLYFESENFNKAKDKIEKILLQDKEHTQAKELRGLIRIKENDITGALYDFGYQSE